MSGSTNAALYTPWINIQDPASSVPGATRWVPPCGAVLGIWASFLTQYGIQQTPAGINASVASVAAEAQFTAVDLTNLQNAQINPIKLVPSAGLCDFGCRTLQPGYPNQFIAVSRTVMQFVHDFIAITQFALFQPNNATLWAQITANLTNYLTQQMQSGVLAGTTPATAFAVTCDSSNNTSSSAQAGIVNASVAVALSSPAEFIVINLQQFQGQTTATVTTT